MRLLRSPFAFTTLALVASLAAPAVGQMIPAHATLRDFEPMGEYVLMLNGVPQPSVQIWKSQKGGSAVLITGTPLRDSLLIAPREREVQRFDPVKVAVGGDGRAFLLADVKLTRESAFTVEADEIVFTVEGKPARLKPKPYLLGLHAGRDLLTHDIGYDFLAKQYQPSPAVLRALRQTSQPVRVRVFFGSWCPHCHEMVPRILRVENALAGSSLRFEFYGLPAPFGDEPEAKRMGIRAVPTGVVYRGNQELGRIEGDEWSIPELAIKKILDSAPAKTGAASKRTPAKASVPARS
jgi:thiol-disulfide isomerase/thioredoxin